MLGTQTSWQLASSPFLLLEARMPCVRADFLVWPAHARWEWICACNAVLSEVAPLLLAQCFLSS